jgi:hypothetical protein
MERTTYLTVFYNMEQAGMAFAAVTGFDFAQQISSETEAEAAFLASAPRHYADARKRDDFEKWRLAECVEIKNCFDNGTFQICNERDVPAGLKVMNCVFSYKRLPSMRGIAYVSVGLHARRLLVQCESVH